MVDFQNSIFISLRKVEVFSSDVLPLLVESEEIIGSYKGIKDYVLFTTKELFQ